MSMFCNMLRPDQITTLEYVKVMMLSQQKDCTLLYLPCSKCHACHPVCAFVQDAAEARNFTSSARRRASGTSAATLSTTLSTTPINNPIYSPVQSAKRKAEKRERRAAVLRMDNTVHDRALNPSETRLAVDVSRAFIVDQILRLSHRAARLTSLRRASTGMRPLQL